MTSNRKDQEETLQLAASRLVGKGLLKPGDTISQRIPEEGMFISLTIAEEHDRLPSVRWTELATASRGIHHSVYAGRPDVGAIAAGQFTWTRLLSRLGTSLPAVFDEQVRHLGVECAWVARLSTDVGDFPELTSNANAYSLVDVGLCFGMGLERLLLNIEILEKCAESFVLAASAGLPVRHIPWWVKFIANGRLMKDQKDAAARHLRGERSILKAGY